MEQVRATPSVTMVIHLRGTGNSELTLTLPGSSQDGYRGNRLCDSHPL